MILNINNTAARGKPCLVNDSNGNAVEYCVRANTKTGRVTCMERNEGKFVIAECGTRVNRVSKDVPAPLLVEWLYP